jgi:lipopolysaccharide biosynthesis glycosyltransferase
MEKINVYYSFGGSNKSFKMTMISIISLITNNKNNIINIYLLDCGAIPQYNIKKTSSEKINEINNYIKNSGVDVTLHILNANSLIKKYMLTGPNENWKNSRYTKISLLYIRYLIAFFKVPKKMLWLDSDTIILNDLSEL